MTAPTRKPVVAVDNRSDDVRVTFNYNPTAVDVIRGVRGRRWHPAEKAWTVPRRSLDDVCARYRAAGFDVEFVGAEPADSAPQIAAAGLVETEATRMAATLLDGISVDCELCGATDVATWANDPWRLRVHRPGIAYSGAVPARGQRCHGHDRFTTELRNAGLALVGPSGCGGQRRLPTDGALAAAGLDVAALYEAGLLT